MSKRDIRTICMPVTIDVVVQIEIDEEWDADDGGPFEGGVPMNEPHSAGRSCSIYNVEPDMPAPFDSFRTVITGALEDMDVSKLLSKYG